MSTCPGCTGDPEDHPGDRFEMTFAAESVSACPHCPDGHRDPSAVPWGVFVALERDGDGQPTHLRVEKTNGSHVSESDAAWLWQLIRWVQTGDDEDSCEPVARPALGVTWGRTGRAG